MRACIRGRLRQRMHVLSTLASAADMRCSVPQVCGRSEGAESQCLSLSPSLAGKIKPSGPRKQHGTTRGPQGQPVTCTGLSLNFRHAPSCQTQGRTPSTGKGVLPWRGAIEKGSSHGGKQNPNPPKTAGKGALPCGKVSSTNGPPHTMATKGAAVRLPLGSSRAPNLLKNML